VKAQIASQRFEILIEYVFDKKSWPSYRLVASDFVGFAAWRPKTAVKSILQGENRQELSNGFNYSKMSANAIWETRVGQSIGDVGLRAPRHLAIEIHLSKTVSIKMSACNRVL
jgi:hypothetical protein